MTIDKDHYNYELAEGPSGLRAKLDEYLAKALTDPEFAAKGHYLLYVLGDQRSLIKVDFSQKPYRFWYNDVLGRPATRIVKETIAAFLIEKCDVKEPYLSEGEESNG